MKSKIILGGILIAATFTFTGCKKGDTGPMGPAGATGPAGNANIEVYLASVTSTDWVEDIANKQWSVGFQLPATADANGAVLLYAQDGDNWAALPHVDYGVTFEYGFNISTKTVEVQAADAIALTMIPNPGPMNFRLVIIPPGVTKSSPSVNWKNWPEVKKTFNLPD